MIQLFKRRKEISVNIKLLAGLDKIEGYDANRGIQLKVHEGTKIKKIIKQINLPDNNSISFIVNGEKADLNRRLKDNDEVFCFLPFAGG